MMIIEMYWVTKNAKPGGFTVCLTPRPQSVRLAQIVNQASKITGHKQPQLQDLFTRSSTSIAIHIYNDPTHPLHSSFQLLPSGRRLKVPLARKNLYKNSFIPTAVTILNNTLFK